MYTVGACCSPASASHLELQRLVFCPVYDNVLLVRKLDEVMALTDRFFVLFL